MCLQGMPTHTHWLLFPDRSMRLNDLDDRSNWTGGRRRPQHGRARGSESLILSFREDTRFSFSRSGFSILATHSTPPALPQSIYFVFYIAAHFFARWFWLCYLCDRFSARMVREFRWDSARVRKHHREAARARRRSGVYKEDGLMETTIFCSPASACCCEGSITPKKKTAQNVNWTSPEPNEAIELWILPKNFVWVGNVRDEKREEKSFFGWACRQTKARQTGGGSCRNVFR